MTLPSTRARPPHWPAGAFLVTVIAAALLASCGPGTERDAEPSPGPDRPAGAPSITHGMARLTDQVFECDVAGWRVTAQGRITASDGSQWTVPAEVAFKSAPKATDLYNDCTGTRLGGAGELDLDHVPVTEIDSGGEVVTAYVFADNYFEFYVNGSLVAVDAVPYWPFNASVMRFRVKRPFTAAFKLVDWEENLGIGSELMHGVPFHMGDGGMAAVFKNQAGDTIGLTDHSWRAQTFYIGPLTDPDCLTLAGGARLSDNCEIATVEDGADVFAAHWTVPDGWSGIGFDDRGWPSATVYSNAEIGGSLNRPAYTNFADVFDNPTADAQFIWSTNLLLDNLVLVRKRIE